MSKKTSDVLGYEWERNHTFFVKIRGEKIH